MNRYRVSRKDAAAFLFGIVDDLDVFQEWIESEEIPSKILVDYPDNVVEKWKTPNDFLDRIKRELLFFAQDIAAKEN